VANIASSKKDARRSAVRAARNRSLKSSVKTKVGKFRRAAADSAEDTEELALTAVAALDHAVSKGVLHAKNAARRKSRLMKRLKTSDVTRTAPAAKPGKPAKAAAKPAAKPAAKSAKATTKAAAAPAKKPDRTSRTTRNKS
jgi:small subunit ribosomal protein S20